MSEEAGPVRGLLCRPPYAHALPLKGPVLFLSLLSGYAFGRKGMRGKYSGRREKAVPKPAFRDLCTDRPCRNALSKSCDGRTDRKQRAEKTRRKSGPETEAETVGAATLFRKRGPGNWGKTRRKSEAATSPARAAPLRTPPPSRLFRKETVEG